MLLRKQCCHRTSQNTDIVSVLRTSTKCWQHPACLEEKAGKRLWTSTTQHHIMNYTQLCRKFCCNHSYCGCGCVLYVRSNKSSPATDSPNTPSPLPDPAFQLAEEAKELVAGVCTLTAEDKGTDNRLEYTKEVSIVRIYCVSSTSIIYNWITSGFGQFFRLSSVCLTHHFTPVMQGNFTVVWHIIDQMTSWLIKNNLQFKQ